MVNTTVRSSTMVLDSRQTPTQVAGQTRTIDATISSASPAAATEWVFARIPSNARIHYSSVVSWDDLASAGAPTLDLGFKAVAANITTDVDALNDGLDLATATTAARVIKDHANAGKMAWEFVSGQTTDPGGFLDVIGTVLDANCNATGDVTMTLVYTVE